MSTITVNLQEPQPVGGDTGHSFITTINEWYCRVLRYGRCHHHPAVYPPASHYPRYHRLWYLSVEKSKAAGKGTHRTDRKEIIFFYFHFPFSSCRIFTSSSRIFPVDTGTAGRPGQEPLIPWQPVPGWRTGGRINFAGLSAYSIPSIRISRTALPEYPAAR